MRIVIVGGGYAGIAAAKQLANQPQVHVRLISRSSEFQPYIAITKYLLKNKRSAQAVPLKRLFHGAKNIQIISDTALSLDSKSKILIGASGAHFAYDKLILATGRRQLRAVPGMDAHTLHPYSYNSMQAIHATLTKLVTGRAPLLPQIIVIGGGCSGVELAGSIQEAARLIADVYAKPFKKVDIRIYEKSDRLLPRLNESAQMAAIKRLTRLGVSVYAKSEIRSIQPKGVMIGGKFFAADMVVWAGGTSVDPFYNKLPEIFTVSHNRLIDTDEYLRCNDADIYIIGDVGATPFSGHAVTAMHDAKYVTGNILREIQKLPPESYQPVATRHTIPIGKRWNLYQHETFAAGGRLFWLGSLFNDAMKRIIDTTIRDRR